MGKEPLFLLMTSNDREKELTGKIAGGDRGAMREFYDEYADYLTAVCLRYVASPGDAKDILQESFIKIFGSMGRFEYRGPGALKAWAGRIVVNESLKWLRERKKLRVSAMGPDGFADLTEDEELALEAVPASVILEMIGSLPDGYRTVFNLYVFEGMSHREIAATLKIAEGSSASQLHRAKGLLVKQIKKYRYER